MTIVLIVITILAAGLLFYLGSIDGSYELRRSLVMEVDRQTAFNNIRDFRNWSDWSPWLVHEPDTKLAFSENPDREGGWYTWDGRRVGAGKLTHVKLDEPRLLEQRIEFVRPFKSVASVSFTLDEMDGQTKVTWGMRGTMPFFLRFMTSTMTRVIAKDYDLGLAMLRGTLDPEAERPVIRFEGDTSLEPRSALTLAFKGGMNEMVTAMQEGFPELAAHVEQSGKTMTGRPFSAYHKVDPKTMYFECDMAVPADESVPEGKFVRKTLGEGKFFRVTLQGSYDFLELAWYSAMSHIRMRKLKQDKSRPSLEVYENDPELVGHSNEILTSLYIPIR